MKCCLVFSLLIVLFCFSPYAAAQTNLETLYSNRQYFQSRDELKKTSAEKQPDILFYRGAIANKFNQPLDSIDLLQSYLKIADKKTEAKKAADAYEMLADDYAKIYNYAKSAAALKILLSEFKNQLDADKLDDSENDFKLRTSLANVAPQTISFAGDTEIQAFRDKAKLLNIPVEINNQKMDFVFDTGANVSTITVSMAQKLGLKIIESDFEVGTSTDKKVKSKLAVAPVLKIGNITLRNVVFLVFEDAALYFPPIKYQINGVVGFPVIEAMRRITITKKDVMIIPARLSPDKSVQNMCLEDLMPLIEASYDNQKMIFAFDTGAQTSQLFPPFLKSQNGKIEKAYKLRKAIIGGAGGVQNAATYDLQNIDLIVAGKTAHFPKMELLSEEINEDARRLYGNLGQDLIKQFDRMTLDFQAMSIVFE